jgi:hypothetical protein
LTFIESSSHKSEPPRESTFDTIRNLTVAALHKFRRMQAGDGEVMVCLKIFQNTAQIVQTVSSQVGGGSSSSSWPEPFKGFVMVYSYLAFNFIGYIPSACFNHDFNIYDTILQQTLIPLGAVVLLGIASIVPAVTKIDSTRAQYWRILILNITLPSTTNVLMNYFITTTFVDGSSYMNSDLSVKVSNPGGGNTKQWYVFGC